MKRTGWSALLIAALLTSLGCQRAVEMVTTAPKDHSWQSQHHPMEFMWRAPWVRVEATNVSDSPHELIQAFANRPDKMACLVRITSDVSKDQISNSDLWAALKEQQLAADPRTTLVREGATSLYGRGFHRIQFETTNEDQIRMCVDLYNRRDGERNWAIRMSYPYSSAYVDDGELPPEFSQLKLRVGGPVTEADLN